MEETDWERALSLLLGSAVGRRNVAVAVGIEKALLGEYLYLAVTS